MMETGILQAVVKANAPAPSSVAVSPERNTGSNVSDAVKPKVAGNVLPSVNEAVANVVQEREQVEKTVSALNSFVQSIQRGIQFSVHEETGRNIITVTDIETDEVIRRFPSEQVLAVAEHIAETLAVPEERSLGLLVNGKA